MKWTRIGKGSYNIAYRNEDSTLVFKAAQDDSPSDLPERSVRLWNLINPHLYPPAKVSRQKIDGKWVRGWTCPYVIGVQASDKEMRSALLDIFNRTGRIVADAVAENNFLKTPSGDIVCIDIGHALEMEQRETVALVGLQRKPSFTSLDTWVDLYDTPKGSAWLNKNQKIFPKTIRTIKALLFIKQHRADITNVDFLKKSPKTIKLLAIAYNKNKGPMLKQALDILEIKCSPDLENSKQKCREVLWGFLSPKGNLVNNEHFVPYAEYRFDEESLQKIMDLMRQINSAQTCDECRDLISVYLEALPAKELEEDVIQSSYDVAEGPLREIETQKNDDFGQFLVDFEHEIDDFLILHELKAKCRTILGGVLLVHGIEQDNAFESEAETKSTTTEYKAELSQEKMKAKITQALRQIDFCSSFAELMQCLDTFSKELPSSDESTMLVQESAFITSVNLCRVMIKTAMNVEKEAGLISNPKVV